MRAIQGLLGLAGLVSLVLGDGTLYLKFEEYDNPGGKGDNGHCCDGKWGICQPNGCDHMFAICLDSYGGSNAMDECFYGERVSDKLSDSNHNVFGPDINGLANPMQFEVRGRLPTQVYLKVMVKDKDTGNFWAGSNDDVDTLRGVATVSTSDTGSGANLQFLKSRTSLSYRLWQECDNDWYNQHCQVYCPPPSRGQYYECDQTTGEKVCLPGWTGRTCEDKITTTPKPTPTPTQPPTTTTTLPPTTTTTTSAPTASASPTPTDIVWVDRDNADCDRLAQTGNAYQDGIYDIQLGHYPPFKVWCDMSDEGWTVIQRRVDGDLSFNRTWKEYQDGFGEAGFHTNYWMGLDNIYRLTNQRSYQLRITMRIGNLEFRSANYESFRIGPESENYALHVEGFSGNAGNALEYKGLRKGRLHDGMPFTTKDRDNDNWKGGNCGKRYFSGWWFNDCYWANLNGVYRSARLGWPYCERGECVSWRTVEGYEDYSLIYTEMKVLPNPRSRVY